MTLFSLLRKSLDALYRWAGYLAAIFLSMILGFVTLQMVSRWGGEIITGAPDFTGYCMAAASFLALPYALNGGSHIRVSLLLNALGRFRKYGEIWCWAVASYLTFLFARFAIKLTYESYRFNDISQGQDAWPIWIPQMSMVLGTILLATCAFDNLITILFTGKDNVRSSGIDSHAE
ncbi:TRAP transporter small permease [Celeribacter halophilus]|jgi:TRAP-type C4-dicarboxylate transport system permease small subunit|uniref:TRAP transporter small permease n=1 Tax=Celeribacter halophilus TaxID=576117 RepID=UPI0026E33791|nr:TRAP transporter small permease subunit [Celeribacter halophilus]MDO6723408.1 TRAP transporter small permease subunit [Celeribacter halophilus]